MYEEKNNELEIPYIFEVDKNLICDCMGYNYKYVMSETARKKRWAKAHVEIEKLQIEMYELEKSELRLEQVKNRIKYLSIECVKLHTIK